VVGQAAQDGYEAGEFVAGDVRQVAWRRPVASPVACEPLGGVDGRVPGAEHAQGAFERAEGAEDGGELRGQGQPEREAQGEQLAEHLGAGLRAGTEVAGDESGDGALQGGFVEVATGFGDLEDGVAELGRVALGDSDEQVAQSGLL
jgi:hypothetical protein